MKKDTQEDVIVVILDELGNEIVVDYELTIPADIAQLYGAFEDDAHDFNGNKNVEIDSGKDRKNTIR